MTPKIEQRHREMALEALGEAWTGWPIVIRVSEALATHGASEYERGLKAGAEPWAGKVEAWFALLRYGMRAAEQSGNEHALKYYGELLTEMQDSFASLLPAAERKDK